MDYHADSKGKLSFKARTKVDVYSKSADPKDKLWEVVIGNKRGLVPKDLLKEEKLIVKNADLVKVPVDFQRDESAPKLESVQLNGSIASDTPETTTTAPLPSGPEKVETASKDIDNTVEKPNITPLQNQHEVLDGTKLPPGYDDAYDEDEGRVGIDEGNGEVNVSDAEIQEKNTILDDEFVVQNDTITEGRNVGEETHTNKEVDISAQASSSKENTTQEVLPESDSKSQELDKSENGTNTGNEERKADAKESKDEPKMVPLEQKIEDLNPRQGENATKANDLHHNKQTNTLERNSNEANKVSLEIKDDVNKLVTESEQATDQTHSNAQTYQSLAQTSSIPEAPLSQAVGSVSGDSMKKETEVSDQIPQQNEHMPKDNVPSIVLHEGASVEGKPGDKEGEININGSEHTEVQSDKKELSEPEETQNVTVNETSVNTDTREKIEQVAGDEMHDGTKNIDVNVEQQGADRDARSTDGAGRTTSIDDRLPMGRNIIASLKGNADKMTSDQDQGEYNNVSQPSMEKLQNEIKDTHMEQSGYNDSNNKFQDNTNLDSEKPLHTFGDEITVEKVVYENEENESSSSPPTEEVSTIPLHEENLTTVDNGKGESHESGATVPPEEDVKEMFRNPMETNYGSEQNHESENESIRPHETSQAEEKITTDKVKNNWFFSNVFDAVRNIWPMKDEQRREEETIDEDLDKILFPNRVKDTLKQNSLSENGFCEKVTPQSCPSDKGTHQNAMLTSGVEMCSAERDFFSSLSDKVLEMVDLLACLLVTAMTTLIFSFGYYCICHSRKEGALLSKLNIVERSLLASNKEAAILKHDLIETRNKLVSIEDNSFGSNDMVIALKKELQDSEDMKLSLQEQVTSLEKELENAAEAGLELNKIVSELLNNQSGDDSIISTVEELQKQLNEQQNTIFQINATLAEKSRENSELQLVLTNQAAKFQEEIQSLTQMKEDLQNDKILLESKLEESKQVLQDELARVANEKRLEILNMGREITIIKEKHDEVYRKLQASEARAQVSCE